MSDLHKEYLGLLDELCGILDQLTEIAQKKITSTRQGDLEVLDQCMKQEQVFALSLKTIERRRVDMLARLQLDQVPLSKLWEHYPQGMKGQARGAVEALRTKYQAYDSASTAARTVMERALRDIEKMAPEGRLPAPEGNAPAVRRDFRA